MAEKKKPKPGPSTGGSSTSRIKRPKGSQPLTLGTGGLRTGKVSKKQQAGTRKVVGALAAATPIGRAAKAGTAAVKTAKLTSDIKKYRKLDKKLTAIKRQVAHSSKPLTEAQKKEYKYLSNEVRKPKYTKPRPGGAAVAKKVVDKDLRPLPQRGKRATPAETKERAQRLAWDKNEKRYDFGVESMSTGYRGGMNVKPRGTKGKNARKEAKIRKIGSN
jgi:hypothetical protein